MQERANSAKTSVFRARMRNGMGWRRFIGVLLITVSALGGCAKLEFAPPPQALRAQFGTVRTVALPSEPVVTPDSPVKGTGSGAMSGAGQGFAGSIVGGLYAGASSGNPLGLVVGVALGVVIAPFAAIVGGVVGASRAHPAEEVEAAHLTFGRILAQVKPDVELAERLVESIERRTDVPVADLTIAKPTGYQAWADDGIDTALELSIRHFQLRLDGSIDPDAALVMGAEAQLFRIPDGAALYRRAWEFRGTVYGYFQLAANDGELFRAEIQRAYDSLAGKIAYDLFISTTPEVYNPGKTKAAGVWTVEVWPDSELPESGDYPAPAPEEPVRKEPKSLDPGPGKQSGREADCWSRRLPNSRDQTLEC